MMAASPLIPAIVCSKSSKSAWEETGGREVVIRATESLGLMSEIAETWKILPGKWES